MPAGRCWVLSASRIPELHDLRLRSDDSLAFAEESRFHSQRTVQIEALGSGFSWE